MSKVETVKKTVLSHRKLDRRTFLKAQATSSSIAALSACGKKEALQEFLQKDFRSMSKEEVAKVLQRLEEKYTKEYRKEFTVSAKEPLLGTFFGYALDLAICIGCRRCVCGCVEENNQSRKPQIHWIQVLEMKKEKGINFRHTDLYCEHKEVPYEGHFCLPVSCQQCKKPPCVKSCPVSATWIEPDGIVVMDYKWCIGCRTCMTACPYGARYFNWGGVEIASEEVNPNTHYLGNRPRVKGVVEKCNFCIQRVREGRYPACVEICPVGATKFGTFSKTSVFLFSRKNSTPNLNFSIFMEHNCEPELTD